MILNVVKVLNDSISFLELSLSGFHEMLFKSHSSILSLSQFQSIFQVSKTQHSYTSFYPSNPEIQTFKMFCIAKLFAVALAATTVVTAATTPQQVVEGFRLLTQKAQALVPVAESINIINTPLIAIGQGPFPVSAIVDTVLHSARAANEAQIIISGFSDQIKIGDALIELLKDDFTGLTQADENLVFDAYEEVMTLTPAS